MHHRRAGIAAVVLVLAVLAATACSATPTDPDPGPEPIPGSPAPGTTAADPTPAFVPEPIEDWEPCGPGAECASVAVPLDYDEPGGATVSLALKRLPATDPEARIGSLFVNPGGPGASGVDALTSMALTLGSEVRAHFDVVAWDPRGVGASEPLDCDGAVLPFYGHDLTRVPAGGEADATAEALGAACADSNGDLLPFVGTVDVARDLESLRQAVGDDELTYAGFSYGSLIGLVYAELFPTHVRALLLDGIVDPTMDVTEQLVSQSASVEEALDRFIVHCDAQARCRPEPDTAAAIDQVFATSRTDPVPARILGERTPFGPSFVSFALAMATYDDALWNTLGTALRAATGGDVTALAVLADQYLRAVSATANLAVGCLDTESPRADAFTAVVEASAAAAPRLGAFNANLGLPCAFWPTPAKPIPSTYTATGSPTIQLWGTTGDNATPYANAVHVAEMLDDAVLVTLEADQHVAAGANSCVTDWQARYLIDRESPPAGTRC